MCVNNISKTGGRLHQTSTDSYTATGVARMSIISAGEAPGIITLAPIVRPPQELHACPNCQASSRKHTHNEIATGVERVSILSAMEAAKAASHKHP